MIFLGEKYHLLQWGDNSAGEEWIHESLFDLADDSMVPEISSCNTRKIKDKRLKHHSAGILISVRPCGVVIFFNKQIH